MKRFLSAVCICFMLMFSALMVSAQEISDEDCTADGIKDYIESLNSDFQDDNNFTDTSALNAAADLNEQIDELVTTCASLDTSADEGEEEVERDGRTPETAFALGESGPAMEEQGSLVVNRFVRGATSSNARFLSYQRPDTNKEWLIVWVSFTCEQSLCDNIENHAFFLVGSESVVYGNLVYARGGNFEDQLVGQTLEGGTVSGWLWFQVSETDSNLVLVENSEDPTHFSLYTFSTEGERVRVSSQSSVNIRSCGGTECAAIDTALNGEELILLEDLGAWLRIRTLEGTEGFISSSLVVR